MRKNRTYHKKKIVIVFFVCVSMLLGLMGRMVYLMVLRSDYYAKKAEELHERERDIKAARGRILDRNGEVLADNKAVCTISVIHSQIKEPDKVAAMLCQELGISQETARKRVETVSAIERVKTNVEKEVGDRIRSYGLAGVKVDEDFKREYPYEELASKAIDFHRVVAGPAYFVAVAESLKTVVASGIGQKCYVAEVAYAGAAEMSQAEGPLFPFPHQLP